jgi:hypothetical protein
MQDRLKSSYLGGIEEGYCSTNHRHERIKLLLRGGIEMIFMAGFLAGGLAILIAMSFLFMAKDTMN